MREVVIRKVLNGFIVQVGCQTVVFQNKTELLVELSNYIDNPAEMEKKYGWDNSVAVTAVHQCATAIPTSQGRFGGETVGYRDPSTPGSY